MLYCYAPNEADRHHRSADGSLEATKGFPTPVTSSPRPLTPPTAQVRHYSLRNLVRKEACFCIRILKPWQTEKEEEKLKGEKTMTSSFHSRQNSECKHSSFPVLSDDRKRGGMKIDNISPSENARSTLTQLRGKEKVGKGKCKNHGHSNYDVTDNDRISSNDVTNLSEDVNKLVARKRHIRVGRSFKPRTGVFEYMGNIYNQTYINFAFILVILTSVIKRMININSPKQLRIAGLPSARRQECVDNNSQAAHLFHPRLLRAVMIVIASFWFKSSSRILKVIFGEQKQHITREGAVFKNTLISNETILTPVTAPPCCCVSRLGNVLQETFWAGKCFKAFIFLFAALYAFYPNYFIIYAINLNSAISFTAFCVLRYIYSIYECFLSFVAVLQLVNPPISYSVYFGLFCFKSSSFGQKKSL